jgi:hypothetical protein
MKFLKDPIWQFVGVIVSIIAIVVTWYVYVDERPYKNLRVEILSNDPLISINSDVAKEIQVLYKNSPVESLSLILLKFENTGNEPIREIDYSEPIRIALSENAEIGEVTIQETRPNGILLTPSVIEKNKVQLAEVLLNPGDQVVLKILAINNDGTLNISTRIAGISDIEIQSVLENGTPANKSTNALVALLCIGIDILFLISLSAWNSRKVIAWRKEKLGFDPARYYYVEAQDKMLKGAPTPDRMRIAIDHLRTCFSWDKSYLQKAQADPIFSHLHQYELYQILIKEYSQKENEASQ